MDAVFPTIFTVLTKNPVMYSHIFHLIRFDSIRFDLIPFHSIPSSPLLCLKIKSGCEPLALFYNLLMHCVLQID